MKVNIIVAASTNNAIGYKNQLPWKLSSDMQRFKQLTTNNVVIMGRKTYESIGKPLPNRYNIVLSRAPGLEIKGVTVCDSIKGALKHIANSEYSNVKTFIIGGEQIYNHALELNICKSVYLTRVHSSCWADAFFNFPIEDPQWKIISSEKYLKDAKNEYDYTFELWEKQ